MSDETPTERFETPGVAEAASVPDGTAAAPGSRQRMLTIILAVVGVVLLIVIAVLVTILIMSGQRQTETPMPAPDASPSASASEEASEPPAPSASTEPEETPSAAPPASTPPSPPPAATGPVFTTFSPANNKSVGCTSSSSSVPVTFTWTSTGANEAAIGVSTSDAFAGPYETGLPPSGSYTLDYQCSNDSQLYTVSIRGSSGVTHKTITLKY